MRVIPDRERIEREVLATLARLIAGCERLDMELAFGMFDRSDAFRMVAGDGTVCTFDEYYESNVGYLGQCESFQLETVQANVLVLRSDLAVLTWSYRVKATLQSGAQDRIGRAGATFLLELRDGEWKVVRYHESSGDYEHRTPEEPHE
jgi:ketosteroid isomerase-like protein